MNNLVGEMPAGAVDLGGSAQAASVGYPVGAIHFGPAWEDDSVQLTHKGWSQITDGMAKSIVRLECEAEELRAEVAMLKEQARILAEERDEARVQYRTTEALGMALVKTIGELRTEKADLFVELVNLKAGSRRATLDEIAESVREKYEPEHEGEGIEN
jgi:cell division protein FtsB